MSGRNPNLTVLGNADGKRLHRSKRELQIRADAEPAGAEALLKPPKELSKEAKKEWNRVVRLYRQLDTEIINDLDMAMLSNYCENVAIYKAAQKAYQTEPLVYTDNSGKQFENPNLKIMDTVGKAIARAADQLCLSPVGRARMGVIAAKKAAEKDPMERWIQNKQKSV